jgi:hypothetical protein
LTRNLFWLKTLQRIFVNPAPVKAFKGVGVGGYTAKLTFFPKTNRAKTLAPPLQLDYFFDRFPYLKASWKLLRKNENRPEGRPSI